MAWEDGSGEVTVELDGEASVNRKHEEIVVGKEGATQLTFKVRELWMNRY